MEVAQSGVSVAWADYDRDGWPDLAVSSSRVSLQEGPIWVYHNQGDGTFREVGQTIGITTFLLSRGYVAWGDYDNDGWLDLVISGYGGREVYRNQGDGTFQPAVPEIGLTEQLYYEPSWVDLDNDGWLDLFITAWSSRSRHLMYMNQRNGTFLEMEQQVLEGNPPTGGTFSAAWGDDNHDGFLDGLLANVLPNQLYRNPGNANHWLIVQPVGGRSNRSAIGAKVWLVVGPQRQLREISGGGGYGSHSLAGAAFGVGAATRIDSLVVEWPSGQVDAWTDLAVNQAIEVTEGQAPAIRVVYGTGAWSLEQPLAQPNVLSQGRSASVRLSIRVVPPTPGQRPDQVKVDLRTLGGPATVALQDDGHAGDLRAGDGI